jgi:hypothetical protein
VGTVLLVVIWRYAKSESTRVFLFHLLTVTAFVYTIGVMTLVAYLFAYLAA